MQLSVSPAAVHHCARQLHTFSQSGRELHAPSQSAAAMLRIRSTPDLYPMEAAERYPERSLSNRTIYAELAVRARVTRRGWDESVAQKRRKEKAFRKLKRVFFAAGATHGEGVRARRRSEREAGQRSEVC